MSDLEKSKAHLIKELKQLRARLRKQENRGKNIIEYKRAKEAAVESEKKFRAAVENSPDFMVFICKDGIIFDVNRLTKGFTREMVIGHSVYDEKWYESKEHIASVRKAVKDSITYGENTTYEYSQTAPDGSLSYYETIVSPFSYDNEGNIVSLQLVTRDITKRREAEQALSESEAKFRSMFENSLLGISQTLHNGQLFNANKAYVKMYGYTSLQEMIKEVKDVGHQLYANPEDRKEVLRILREKGYMEPREVQVVKRDGSKFYVLVSACEVKDDEGNHKYYQAEHIDITARKSIENQCNEALKLLENVYASLDEAVFEVDPLTRSIISCNDTAERIFGWSKGEMVGRNTEFLHVNDKTYKEFGKSLFPALDRKGVFHTEYNLRKKDGTVFPSDHTVKDVKNTAGKRILLVSVVRDITSQQEMMKELKDKEESLKAKNVRLAELNTTLKVLLDQRDQEKKILEENFSESIQNLIIPYLDRIRKSDLDSLQKEYIDVLESNLREIIKPYIHRISGKLMKLSPSETRIASYIKQGYRNKEISSIMNLSLRTVEFHRNNIRKKLGIKNRKINLKTYLSNIR